MRPSRRIIGRSMDLCNFSEYRKVYYKNHREEFSTNAHAYYDDDREELPIIYRDREKRRYPDKEE